LVAMAIIWTRYFVGGKSEAQNLFFTVSSDSPNSVQLKDVSGIIKKYFKAAELKRFDENENIIEVSFLVETVKSENLQSCKEDLQKLNKSVKVTFIDNKNY